MPKIYISPAYHKWNPCAISGCDETTHNNLYCDELEVYLKACKIDYKRGPQRMPKSNEDGTTLMNKAIKESNAYKPDIHYVSHTNASNGSVRGYRPMIYPTNNAAGEKLANIIIKYRKEIYNQPIKLVKTSEWAELRETSAVAYYEEHIFHDNYQDAKWFHDNLRNIAKQTCRAFCEYFGIKFVDPYAVANKPEVKELFRVRKSWQDAESQSGAYVVFENAIKKAKETKQNVYDNTGKLVWEYKEDIIPPVVETPKKEPSDEKKQELQNQVQDSIKPENNNTDKISDDKIAISDPEQNNKKSFLSTIIDALASFIKVIAGLFKK